MSYDFYKDDYEPCDYLKLANELSIVAGQLEWLIVELKTDGISELKTNARIKYFIKKLEDICQQHLKHN